MKLSYTEKQTLILLARGDRLAEVSRKLKIHASTLYNYTVKFKKMLSLPTESNLYVIVKTAIDNKLITNKDIES